MMNRLHSVLFVKILSHFPKKSPSSHSQYFNHCKTRCCARAAWGSLLTRFIAAIATIFATVVSSFTVAQAQEAPAMIVPGQFNVSPTGAATYTIPIVVPPGTAGMVPSLSLDYSSQAGNGIMGLGWSLSGLPSIGRCKRTIVQDGVNGGINYDENDRYCLEGQRLVLVSGSTYGDPDTVYRTENEGFSRVTAKGGTPANGPDYFIVETKSGQTMWFGDTSASANSRFMADDTSPKIRAWGISRIEDKVGNYLTVEYHADPANGHYRPTRINYTGNDNAPATAPYNYVEFEYNTTPTANPQFTVIPKYRAGFVMKNLALLTNVKTYAEGNLVSDYRVTYDPSVISGSVNRPRVTQIELCDAGGNLLATDGISSRHPLQSSYISRL